METTSTKLPVYLLIDASAEGATRGHILKAISTLVGGLKSDPVALEIVNIGVITYGSSVMPNDDSSRILMSLDAFELPNIQWQSTCNRTLGAAFSRMNRSVAEEVRWSSIEQRGDYSPIVFVMAAGLPTDDWKTPLEVAHRFMEPERIVLCCAQTGPQMLSIWTVPSKTDTLLSCFGGGLELDRA